MSDDTMQDFEPIPQVSNEEILNSLMDPENILMKTEVKNIPAVAGLLTLAAFFNMVGLDDNEDLMSPTSLLINYVNTSSILAVSKDRKGRKEIIEGIIGIYNRKEPEKKDEQLGVL